MVKVSLSETTNGNILLPSITLLFIILDRQLLNGTLSAIIPAPYRLLAGNEIRNSLAYNIELS